MPSHWWLKKILLLFAISLVAQWAFSQPKWVDKAKRAVFSIVTYDKDDKMLNTGNGFFVSEDGVAMSDYSLFKGARRAVIINYEGKEIITKARRCRSTPLWVLTICMML